MNSREFAQSATTRTCEAYKRAIAAGEDPRVVVAGLAADAGVQNPAIWRRLRSGGVLPPYQSKTPKQPTRKRAKREEAGDGKKVFIPEPVDRDPCPRCGVRRDFGCQHSGARLGMIL